MSTANKLTYLNGTKQAIKQAINEDFEVIDNNTTFREYADEISSNNAKYKDLIPKETANATNTLDISNSSGLDKALVTQYGNTYQATTTGKNLFDEDTIIPASIGSKTNATYDSATRTLTLTNNSSDTFLPTLYGNSPYINGINITVKANTTYTLSFNVDQPVSTLKMGVYGVQANNTYILCSGWYQTTSFSFNTNEFTQIAIRIGTTSASGVVTKFSDFQLEESPSATPFEPYTNGASPNPDYPQEIVNISGNSTLNDVGKNLFDGVLELGNFNTDTGEKVQNSNYIINTNPIPVEELTNYKISSNGTGIRMYVFEYKKDMTYNLSTRKTVNADSYLTTNSGTKYINFRTIDVNTNLQEKIQVEKGTASSDYEPYKEQSFDLDLPSGVELCKIGDYRDKIYPSNGKWYLEKKISKVVLDGTQTINQINTTQTNTTRVMYQNFVQRKSSSIDLYCSHLAGVINWNVDTEGMYINNTDLVFRMNKTTIGTTIAEINNWLSNNNVTLEYTLATPITTEITESNYPTLYEQLNNIKLFEGVNHITMTNESGLDVEFDIEYYKDWKLD